MNEPVDIDCLFCEKKFKGFVWVGDSCPHCGEKYTWDEQYSEDDYWPVIDWIREGSDE